MLVDERPKVVSFSTNVPQEFVFISHIDFKEYWTGLTISSRTNQFLHQVLTNFDSEVDDKSRKGETLLNFAVGKSKSYFCWINVRPLSRNPNVNIPNLKSFEIFVHHDVPATVKKTTVYPLLKKHILTTLF